MEKCKCKILCYWCKRNSNHLKTILLNERQNDGHGKVMLHLVFVSIKVEL